MAKLLYHLGRWSYINRWKVIIAWIFIVAAAGGATLSLMKPMTTEYSISGTPPAQPTVRPSPVLPRITTLTQFAAVDVGGPETSCHSRPGRGGERAVCRQAPFFSDVD